MGRERRTNPGFLSDNEARRESRRLQEMVRGITEHSKTANNTGNSAAPPKTDFVSIENTANRKITHRAFHAPSSRGHLKKERNLSPVLKLGYTQSFSVDFDTRDKLVAIYGKEIPWDSPYKLKFGLTELPQIIRLLENARGFAETNGAIRRKYETNNFAAEYDGSQGVIMLYEKCSRAYPFKLAFNGRDLDLVIWILKKARSL